MGAQPEPAREPGPRARGALDALDRAIVAHLQEDGRRPFRAIAAALDVPEATVRFRAHRMFREGVVDVQAIPNPFRLGYEVLAVVLMQVAPVARRAVIAELTQWPEIVYLSTATGRIDLMAQVVLESHHDLYVLLAERLAAVPGITSSETLMELEVHKYRYAFPKLSGG